jgi:hypothetical protein
LSLATSASKIVSRSRYSWYVHIRGPVFFCLLTFSADSILHDTLLDAAQISSSTQILPLSLRVVGCGGTRSGVRPARHTQTALHFLASNCFISS